MEIGLKCLNNRRPGLQQCKPEALHSTGKGISASVFSMPNPVKLQDTRTVSQTENRTSCLTTVSQTIAVRTCQSDISNQDLGGGGSTGAEGPVLFDYSGGPPSRRRAVARAGGAPPLVVGRSTTSPPPIRKLGPKFSDICTEEISVWPLEPRSADPPIPEFGGGSKGPARPQVKSSPAQPQDTRRVSNRKQNIMSDYSRSDNRSQGPKGGGGEGLLESGI